MYPITSFVKRHALVTFFALAYALWWLVAALWLLIACAVLVTAGRELGRLPARPAEATRVARTLTS